MNFLIWQVYSTCNETFYMNLDVLENMLWNRIAYLHADVNTEMPKMVGMIKSV